MGVGGVGVHIQQFRNLGGLRIIAESPHIVRKVVTRQRECIGRKCINGVVVDVGDQKKQKQQNIKHHQGPFV